MAVLFVFQPIQARKQTRQPPLASFLFVMAPTAFLPFPLVALLERHYASTRRFDKCQKKKYPLTGVKLMGIFDRPVMLACIKGKRKKWKSEIALKRNLCNHEKLLLFFDSFAFPCPLSRQNKKRYRRARVVLFM